MTRSNSTLVSREKNFWLNQAAALPLGFAQVREDAEIDMEIVRRLRGNADLCLVASGGCTAAYLAAGSDAKSITLVDTNLAQIDLSRIKLYLLEKESIEARLALLGHQSMVADRRFDRLETISRGLDISSQKFGPEKIVALNGLDYSGRYEMLFAQLQKRLANLAQSDLGFLLSLNNPAEQVRFTEESGLGNVFDIAFEEIFALRNLVALFGKEATQNALMPFAGHFRQRLAHVVETLPNADNPFLHQLLVGRYGSEPAPWLKCNPIKISANLAFVHVQMNNFLEDKSAAFDFIGLSNILDWLSPHQAKGLLQASFKALRPGGVILIRQLNSTLDIAALAPDFDWQNAAELEKADRSFFYRRLHLGGKS